MAVRRSLWDVLQGVIGLTAALGLLASAIVFYQMDPRRQSADAPVGDSRSTAARPGVGGPPTVPAPTREPTRAPIASSTSAPADPRPADPRVSMLITPTSNGEFEIVETVVAGQPMTSLTLRPTEINELAGVFAQAVPAATAVEIQADSRRVEVPNGRVSGPVTLPLGDPVQKLELRYLLSGVTVRSTPSKAGRALGAVGPMVSGLSDDLPVSFEMRGSSVRNIRCPHLPPSQQACATGAAPRLRVGQPLPGRDAEVILQLDLPVA